MEAYKEEFIRFMIKKGALKFGEFKLKSGRLSPYFISTGVFCDGESIAKLGYFYASKIKEIGKGFDVLFGPAYKGIPLSVAASISLQKDFNINVDYAFDRKEVKEHGEKDLIVGAKMEDGKKVIMIDDVITAGTSISNTLPMLKKLADVKINHIVISVNRKEKTNEGVNAIKNLEDKFGVKVHAIVDINEIKEFLHNKEIDGKILIDDEMKKKMDDYAKEYGVEE